jgi:hypothetical protein
MSEAQWRDSSDPTPMLDFLRGKASDRKLRLFAVSCCRRIWQLLSNETYRYAVEVAERDADQLATREERRAAAVAVMEATQRPRSPLAWQASAAVAFTISVSMSREIPSVMGSTAAAAADAAAQVAAFAGVSSTNVYPFSNHLESYPAWLAARDTEKQRQSPLVRDTFGNPFRPVTLDPAWLRWKDGAIAKIAQSVYDDRRFSDLPILADALEDAGGTDRAVLEHCRAGGEHVRGCWVVDWLLGKT